MRHAAWVVLAVATLAFVPTVRADESGAFGDIVLAAGVTEQLLRTDAGLPDVFVVVDADNDRALDAGEAVYLSAGGGVVRDRDVRIANAPGGVGGPGTSVALADPDAADPTQPLDGFTRYADVDGDGAFQAGDVLYFDLGGAGSGRVTINDVVLAGPGAGRLVATGDPRLAQDLAHHFGSIRFHDKDRDNRFDAGEPLYDDTDNDGRVTFQDIRLGTPFGTIVAFGDADATPILRDGDSPASFAFTDVDGDGRFDSDDYAYLARSGERVRANDVRLVNAMLGAPGGQVRGSDVDAGNPVTFLDVALRYHDADGNGRFTVGDTLVLDHAISGSGVLTSRDIVLSGPSAGLFADESGVDLRSGLRDYTGTLRYMDVDGDARYGRDDVVYADTNENSLADRGDVRLSGPPLVADVPAPPAEETPAAAGPTPSTAPQECPDGTTVPAHEACPEAPSEDADSTPEVGADEEPASDDTPATGATAETDDHEAGDILDGAEPAPEDATDLLPPPADEALTATQSADATSGEGEQDEDDGSLVPGPGVGAFLAATAAAAVMAWGRRKA